MVPELVDMVFLLPGMILLLFCFGYDCGFSLSLLMMLFVIANVEYTLGKRKVRSVSKIILYYVFGSMLV